MKRFFLFASFLIAASGLSTGCTVPLTSPLLAAPTSCRTVADITGTWSGPRLTQLGPARTTFEFRCDCVYKNTARLLWATMRGEQSYSVVADTIVIKGEKSDHIVRFVRSGNRLLLWWGGREPEELRLKKAYTCGSNTRVSHERPQLLPPIPTANIHLR